jgi:hypothetical protein
VMVDGFAVLILLGLVVSAFYLEDHDPDSR